MDKLYWTSFNYLPEFQLSHETVLDCSHQGRCDEDVEYWQGKLNLNLNRELMIKELKEYGAWSLNELNALDDDELEQKIIWIAACNIKDEEGL
jgi:hypothetical protein